MQRAGIDKLHGRGRSLNGAVDAVEKLISDTSIFLGTSIGEVCDH